MRACAACGLVHLHEVARRVTPSPGRPPRMGSVIKKRRKRMSKKKHRKLLRKTRVQRRKLGK
ncbi:hypothetical protein GCM10009609_59320 [Pseudonocardia aurantiaca]